MKVRRVPEMLAVLVLAAALAGGCSTSSTGPDGVDDGEVLRDSPQRVLDRIEQAYEAMDAWGYLDCLADAYEFHLSEDDLDEDPSLPQYWGFAAEIAIHNRMFGDESVHDPADEVLDVSLELQLTSTDVDTGEDQGDPSDDRWTCRVQATLTVSCPDDLQLYASEECELVLRVDPDETGPDGETLYEVIRHESLSNPRWEGMSWGRIKAVYRDVDPYTLRDSPEHTLTRFIEVYEAMDSEAYLDCLANDFEFHLAQIDVENDETLPEFWGVETERTVHRRMFGDEPVDPMNEVQHLTLELDAMSSSHDEGVDADDPLDDTWTCLVDVDLMIWYPNQRQRRANPMCRFVLAVDPDETGPGGETLYEVVSIEDELHGGREGTSWGQIKALYR